MEPDQPTALDKRDAPIVVAPSKNVTRPVGDPPEEICTFAVNTMICPAVDGLLLDVTIVVVCIEFTICVSADDELPMKFASPE